MKQQSLLLLIFALIIFSVYGSSYYVDRIVGGTPAKQDQFPFFVSIQVFNAHVCGGSLIHYQWILTAAHCCIGFASFQKLIKIIGGQYNLDDERYSYSVDEIKIHEGFIFNSTTIRNDICLLKLNETISITNQSTVESIKIIQLERDHIDTKRDVQVMGLGDTFNQNRESNVLNWITMQTIPYDDCLMIWQQQQQPATIGPNEICALAAKPNTSTCHGDSGGGLISYDTTNNLPTLIGIVSWGIPCAKGLPDVFTRVSSFIKWIDSYILKN